MKCVHFWMSDPIDALKNIRTIFPHDDQCLDEKLNGVSFFVVLFSLFLAAMGYQYFWVFMSMGLFAVAVFKYFFAPTKYLEDVDYATVQTDHDVQEKSYTHENPGYIYEEDLRLIPALNNTGDTFEEIKGNVADQIVASRFPSIASACRYEFIEY